MSLQIGQTLGSYEITSLLGKAGMGEVYQARDSKLKRDVAIRRSSSMLVIPRGLAHSIDDTQLASACGRLGDRITERRQRLAAA
jgi:serine/threonine protein kinase